MEKRPILAIMYDYDHTLSPRDMQEYGFIPDLGMEADVFWHKCLKAMKRNQMDQLLAYMYMMLEEAKGKLIVNRNMLRALGKDVQLFDGVSDWFARVNEYARSRGLQPEHYIISSGLKEIIEGTPIAKEFKEIYAASFCYDEHGVACWPAMAVNYTSKTQFLFRVNKGVLDVTEHRALNEFMPEEKRRVPVSNMIYVGDGLTDVPSMKLTKLNGGMMDKLMYVCGIVGLMVIGAMVASMVGLTTPITFASTGLVLQDVLNSILPNLLNLGIVMLMYTLIRKKVKTGWLLGICIVGGVAINALGLLV